MEEKIGLFEEKIRVFERKIIIFKRYNKTIFRAVWNQKGGQKY